jgi:tetratricopeptide (TPR) repeat protein
MKLLTVLAVVLLLLGCGETVPDTVYRAQESFKEVQQGDKAAVKGDLDTAITHYEKALDFTPSAPKFRFAYAQLLYWKGLTYAQESHRMYMKTEGWEFDDATGKWLDLKTKPPKEESAKLTEKSAEYKREGLIYFNKALHQLMRCDIDWNYAVEAVPYAMGLVYIFMEEYDKAIAAFKRVQVSSRVSEDYRKKIGRLIELIEEQKQDIAVSGQEPDLRDFGP